MDVRWRAARPGGPARRGGSDRIRSVTDSSFADVLDANRAYASGFPLAGLEPQAARGLAILTCMDSRIEPLALLGLVPGDAKILRNAGARITDDALRSL